MHLAFVV